MKTVLVDRPANGVALVTLNRPQQLNSMNMELVHSLHDALHEISKDEKCHVVALTGAGRGFA